MEKYTKLSHYILSLDKNRRSDGQAPMPDIQRKGFVWQSVLLGILGNGHKEKLKAPHLLHSEQS